MATSTTHKTKLEVLRPLFASLVKAWARGMVVGVAAAAAYVTTHAPVMVAEVVAALKPALTAAHTAGRATAMVVDCTLGGGGHAAALAGAATHVRVVGVDVDAAAVATAAAAHPELVRCGRLALRHADYLSTLRQLADGGVWVDGVVADLGVSSFQLDAGHRGFSFLRERDGPLDMRFDGGDAGGPSAADLVNHLAEGELAALLATLGEEPRSAAVAASIVARRRDRPFVTTADLAAVVADAVGVGRPGHHRHRRQGGSGGAGGGRHPATRTFLALRMAVNGEMGRVAVSGPHCSSAAAWCSAAPTPASLGAPYLDLSVGRISVPPRCRCCRLVAASPPSHSTRWRMSSCGGASRRGWPPGASVGDDMVG